MPVLTPIARPLLASIFIMQGLDNLLRPERVAPLVEPILRPLADRLPGPPTRAEQAVRAKGALHLVAGSMLAFGRWPRLTSLTLAATMVPTTLAAHRLGGHRRGRTAAEADPLRQEPVDLRRAADRREAPGGQASGPTGQARYARRGRRLTADRELLAQGT